jgi:hypothetical protein
VRFFVRRFSLPYVGIFILSATILSSCATGTGSKELPDISPAFKLLLSLFQLFTLFSFDPFLSSGNIFSL